MESEPTGQADQADALRRALVAIRDLRARLAEAQKRGGEPVAIVGMACRFPGGANSPEALWDLLERGVDATVDIPPERWDADALYDPDPDAPGRMYVRRGAFLQEPVDHFDPGFFHISPREATRLDPIHRLLLELAWESLERAGIPADSLAGTLTGVFIGQSGSDYALMEGRAETSLEAIDNYRGLGTAACVGGGRISHFLGLHGPNVVLDTACSSGLVALVQAIESLRSGRCDQALAGSAHLMLSPEGTIFLSRMRALSPDGRCRTYDAGADGYGRGEGGAMFVLKRLADAQAAGDSILAVIRGCGWNHDGRSSGLTVPNPVAQRAVITAALKDAGLTPSQISFVETHGTATPLGDPIELRALSEVLGTGRSPDTPLLVGSIKTNFGHLEAAAGLAGLMKAVLALHHGVVPPHLHFRQPTPHVDWTRLPLRVVTEATELPRGEEPRCAGVSAFGFSGTNAHVLVEESPAAPVEDQRGLRPRELLLLSGHCPEAVRELARLYRERVQETDRRGLADLATTSAAGRAHLSHRVYAAAGDPASMAEALRRLESAGDTDIADIRGTEPGEIAFLFTGQGAQYPEMARELWQTSPTFRQALERCAGIVDPHLDQPLVSLLTEAVDAECLRQTAIAQPALFAFEYALAELWRSWGVEPSYVAGHSLGEYVAATVAGVMDLEEALPLVVLRGRLMQELPAGGRMAAVFTEEEAVRSAIAAQPGLSIAAINGPENIVISGDGGALEEVFGRFQEEGIGGQYLEVSHAFHSALMEPMLDRFEQAVAKLSLRAPRIPLVSNLTGRLLTAEEATDPARWRRHVREPVQYHRSIRALLESGVNTFIELGPHPTLCALGQSVAGGDGARWLPSLRRKVPAWEQLLESLGGLYTGGHNPDWQGFTRDHPGLRTVGPTYPFQRQRYWFSDDTGVVTGPVTVPLTQRLVPDHPLLGHEVQSPALSGWAFETLLASRRPPYLDDHRVQNQLVVPGAVYVEMMLATAREGLGCEQVELVDLTFEQPLVLAEEEGTIRQVLIGPPEDGKAVARVASLVDSVNGPRWTTHATAGVRLAPAITEEDAICLDEIRSTFAIPADVAELYQAIASHGVTHGPSFRVLTECRTGPGGALGRVELPDAVTADLPQYRLHPCVLDAGFQLLASLVNDGSVDAGPFLPASIDHLRVRRPPGATCWVHAAVREPGPDNNPDLILADLRFFDPDGEVVTDITGLALRRLKHRLAAAVDPDSPASPRYSVTWQDGASPAPCPQHLEGNWLLLEDEDGVVAAGLRDLVTARGGRCLSVRRGERFQLLGPDRFTVNPASPEDWERLLREVKEGGEPALRGLFHLWALDPPPAEAGDPMGELLDVTTPFAELARLGVLPAMEGGVHMLTRNAAGPGLGEADGWQAGVALWGMLSVLQAEHPELTCRLLDLGGDRVVMDSESLLSHLLGGVEERIVLDGGRLLVPRLRRTGESDDYRAVPAGEAYRIAVDRHGTLDALYYLPVDRSAPGAGEVEVRVRLAGLNFRDVLNVLGQYPGDPGLPGIEFVGTVTRVGPGVEDVSPGDRVMGIGAGTLASHVVVAQHAIVPIPAGLTTVEAATIPLAFLTAEYGLSRLASLQPGERVLIHAAAGGVGQAAVQIAMAAGAEVFVTAGSDYKRDFLRGQGWAQVFDSRDPAFADQLLAATGGEGVDVVLNALTGEMLRRSLALLRPGGRFLELGKAEILDPAEHDAINHGITYIPYDLGTLLLDSPEEFAGLFRELVARFEAGGLRPLPSRVFPAEEVVGAFRHMAKARHIGKIVVRSGRPLSPQEPEIAADVAYLVTGATGGVGRQVVEWLVGNQAGAVTLVARSEPEAEFETWLESLRQHSSTRLQWFRGDVADPTDAERAVEAAGGTGLPLRGVFHCAGATDDGLLEGQSRDRFSRVFRPKVAGAWNLHKATATLELDHFVLFSSTSGLLGGPGQSGYAVANAYLDALAAARVNRGLAALSIAWGAWDGAGMAARLSDTELRMLESRGLGFLSPEQAIQAMESLLSETGASGMVAEIDWSKIAASVPQVPPLLESLLSGGRYSGDHSPAERPRLLLDVAELDAMEPAARLEQVGRYVQSALAGVLRLDPDKLDTRADIADYGFDSLLAVELRNRIEKEVGVLMPASALLTCRTPAALGKALYDMIAGTAAVPESVQDRVDEDAWTEGEI